MAERLVDGFEELNPNIRTNLGTKTLDRSVSGGGTVPVAISGTISAVEYGDEVYHQTVLTLVDVPVTMRDTEQGGGVQIYDFPVGRIMHLHGTATIAVTTTSALASTLNAGSTCNYGVGTVTQSNATVATTEQDLVNVEAFTSSATIDVAGADATGVGAGVLASHDGTSTAINAFLNLAVAGATDIDADATVTVSGTVTFTWINATKS